MDQVSDGAAFRAQMLAGTVYARTRKRADRLAFAREGVYAALEVAGAPYISLSFGKQSICLAHMVHAIAPEVPAYFLASDETWSMYDYVVVVEQFRVRVPELTIQIVQTSRLWSAKNWKAGRDSGDRDLQSMCSRREWDLVFMGLAVDESKKRELTLRKGGPTHPSLYRYADGTFRSCPLMNWGLDDIAAYIGEHNLPVLNIYRRFGLQCRTTARLTKAARDRGAWALRWTNSRGRRQIVNRFEEIDP